MSTELPTYQSGLGASDRDHIWLLGQDLAEDVLGKVSFGELAYWLMLKRRPSSSQLVMFEAVLAALADHGFTPTAIASRLTYLSAPDSLQGALAAGLLGGGSRFLGVTENTAHYLAGVISDLDAVPTDSDGWDTVALDVVRASAAAKTFVPGLGHPVHKITDPRTPVLFALARREGEYGPHLALYEAIGRKHPEVLGRTLPLNGAGVCGAVLADIQIPLGVVRGVALLARCAGLLGQLAEEMENPVAMDMYMNIDRNTDYLPHRS